MLKETLIADNLIRKTAFPVFSSSLGNETCNFQGGEGCKLGGVKVEWIQLC